MASRDASWYINWLSKDDAYATQPYHQLAGVLRGMGRTEAYNDVLYAGKERERSEAKPISLKWWGLSLLNLTIGHGFGHRYFRVLYWIAAFSFIGAQVYFTTPQGDLKTCPELFIYSFDQLLPLVKLDEASRMDFNGWQRYYFYAHKLIEYILGSFVIAGLSGITKK